MNGAYVDAVFGDELGQPCTLGSGKGKIELGRDAFFEHVEMLGQRQHRLHHVQVMHHRCINARQCLGKEVRLLLIVALEADAIARLDDCLQQGDDIGSLDDLVARTATQARIGAGEPALATLCLQIPGGRGRYRGVQWVVPIPITRSGRSVAMPGKTQMSTIASSIRPTNGNTPQITSASGMSGAMFLMTKILSPTGG